jgi:hypothetical protein
VVGKRNMEKGKGVNSYRERFQACCEGLGMIPIHRYDKPSPHLNGPDHFKFGELIWLIGHPVSINNCQNSFRNFKLSPSDL